MKRKALQAPRPGSSAARRRRAGPGVPVQKLERIMAIHRALKSGRRCTADDFARELEVHVRSIYRDVQFLRDRLFAPLESRGSRGYRYTRDYDLPDLTLTEGELLAFLVAERVVEGYAGAEAPFFRRMRAGLLKLSRGLTDKITVPLDDLFSRRYRFDAGPLRSVLPEVLDTLEESMGRRRAMVVRYRALKGDEVTERVIEPYHLRNHRGDWYVVAWCRLRQDMRTFSASRILECRLEDDPYRIPADFDPEEYFRSALSIFTGEEVQEVRIHFSPRAARRIGERQWHSTQELEAQEDDSVVLAMRVAPTVEVVRWVLAQGSDARVLSPPELVEEVRREARAMAEGYG